MIAQEYTNFLKYNALSLGRHEYFNPIGSQPRNI